MSVSLSVTKTNSLGGKTFNESTTVTGDGAIVQELSVAAGSAGTLTTRTDADTGVVTVDDSGHAFAELDRVDLYWTGGARRGMSVSSVSVNGVTIDGGSGDDLPSQDTVVTLIEPTEVDAVVLGTNVNGIVLYTSQIGQFVFADSGDSEHLAVELTAGKAYSWTEGNGTTNPITGDSIAKVFVSHGGTSSATMRVGVLYDN